MFHPHNPTVTEALINDVKIIDNTEFIKRVLSEIYYVKNNMNKAGYPLFYQAQCLFDDLILLSTDAGGFKPLMKLCDNIGWQGETASAAKSRKYIDGKSKLIQELDRQDFGGKDILIVDDLLIGGATLIGLGNMLKERNCGKLYAALSHITIKNPRKELENIFDIIYSTNSKYNMDEYNLSNLNIINLFP